MLKLSMVFMWSEVHKYTYGELSQCNIVYNDQADARVTYEMYF